VPLRLPAAILDACEPCRRVPRRPSRTWSRTTPSAKSRWAQLRKYRSADTKAWRNLADSQAAAVAQLLARLSRSKPPTALLAPEVEALWLWLEGERVTLNDHASLIIDLWAQLNLARAVENLAVFAATYGEMVSLEEPRRLRAWLSVAPEEKWLAARAVARRLAAKAKPKVKALLAYLFEEASIANALARTTKRVHGYHLLLGVTVTDPTQLRLIVKRGKNGWGLAELHTVVPATAVLLMGKRALPVVEYFVRHWAVAEAELAWLRPSRPPA